MPHVRPTRVLDGLAAFAFVDDVSIAVTNVPAWSDASIDRYLAEITTLGERVGARCSVLRFVGSVPGSSHRRRIVEWLEREGLSVDTRTCLLTDSPLIRGAMTAYGWLTSSESAAFPPSDLVAASEFAARGGRAKPEDIREAIVGCHELLGVSLSGDGRAR